MTISDDLPSFRDLHYRDEPLLLPNAWDVGSALGFVAAGFPALGTTSFGVNASTGVPDAAGAGREATVALIRKLRVLPVHVTADIEDVSATIPTPSASSSPGSGRPV